MNVRNFNELIQLQKQRGATETDGQWICMHFWLFGGEKCLTDDT